MKNRVFIPPYVVNEVSPILPFSQVVDWGLEKLAIQEIHKLGITGKGVKVGVIDSGCFLKHQDLVIASAKDFTGTTPDDTSGHGTHVAGIIAAKDNTMGVLGVAPDVELHIYKALNGEYGSLDSITKALKAAIEDGMDIINMSLGTQSDAKSLQSLCKKAKEKGIVIVAASGNTGLEQNFYPASYDSCIAVGAVDKLLEVADFTTHGEHLDIVAPGSKILSTHLKGKYAILSGTSMAAPFVSGCLALLKQAGIELTYENIIKSTIDILEIGFDKKSGYGIIDPKVALQLPKQEVKASCIKSFFKKLL
jgi:subtilisin family serine protease